MRITLYLITNLKQMSNHLDKNEQIINGTLELVSSSQRVMPAHFTSGNGRTQTFLIDFEDLNAEED